MVRSYKDLVVWQKAMALVFAVYEVTQKFPDAERFGLVSQMRRSAVSIPSNIAEGKLRGGDREFRRYLDIAFASVGELETQIEIAKGLPETRSLDFKQCDGLIDEVMRMLHVMIVNRPSRPKA